MYIEDGRHGMEIEVCVSSIEDVITVQKAGATRIELCTAMEVIGITPTLSNYLLAKKVVDIPVLAFIRPRAGGFNYSDLEFEVMKRDMKAYYDAGARSFVFGILTEKDRKSTRLNSSHVRISYAVFCLKKKKKKKTYIKQI